MAASTNDMLPPRDPNEPPITILSIMEAVAKSGTQ